MANPPPGSLAYRTYPELPLTGPPNWPPGVPPPVGWTPPSLLRSTVGPLGGPIFELHRGDYLNCSTDAICIAADNVQSPAFDVRHALQQPGRRAMRLDLHASGTTNGPRRWHRRAWRDVDVFNATWDYLGGIGGAPVPVNFREFKEGNCRETTSGILNSNVTLMIHLPVRGRAPLIPGAPYDFHSLRMCIIRILDRAYELPVAPQYFPWRTRPTSISIQLLGSNPHHGYGYDGAAESIIRSVRNWFEWQFVAPGQALSQGALRRAAITRVYFITPDASQTDCESVLTQNAWERAWVKYLPSPPGNPAVIAPLPNVYNDAEDVRRNRQRVLRRNRIVGT